jgi:hypothetical protein
MTLFLLALYITFTLLRLLYVQVFMRTPKQWQNSQPVDGAHYMEEEEEYYSNKLQL